jgi:hypothetical protein
MASPTAVERLPKEVLQAIFELVWSEGERSSDISHYMHLSRSWKVRRED